MTYLVYGLAVKKMQTWLREGLQKRDFHHPLDYYSPLMSTLAGKLC